MIRRLGIVAAAAVAATFIIAPAHANIGEQGGEGGYSIAVSAVVTGDAGPIPTGSISVPVPPKCWWTPFDAGQFDSDYADFDPEDPEQFQEYYENLVDQLRIHAHAAYGYYALPSYEDVEAAVEAVASGQQRTWYRLECRDGVDPIAEGYTTSRGAVEGAGPVPIQYRSFPTGDAPEPLIDVADVAEVIWDRAAAALADPDLDRNPRIAGANGATLVNLPTWFWVTNQAEALADDGTVHLEVSIPGTPVQMSLDAQMSDVLVTSPVGAQSCTVDEVKTAYAAGAAEAEACTVELGQAGTWPVTATMSWEGTWQGVDNNGPQSGTLEVLGRSSTVNVGVAESQALVNDVS